MAKTWCFPLSSLPHHPPDHRREHNQGEGGEHEEAVQVPGGGGSQCGHKPGSF